MECRSFTVNLIERYKKQKYKHNGKVLSLKQLKTMLLNVYNFHHATKNSHNYKQIVETQQSVLTLRMVYDIKQSFQIAKKVSVDLASVVSKLLDYYLLQIPSTDSCCS